METIKYINNSMRVDREMKILHVIPAFIENSLGSIIKGSFGKQIKESINNIHY